MSKSPKGKKPRSLTVPPSPPVVTESDFDVVVALIEVARTRAVTAANIMLIDLYWNIGEYISRKVAEEQWGRGTVEALAVYIQRRRPGASGFSASNLWRMRQFFETYSGQPKLAPLVRELSWTHNLLIMSRCKHDEEREFYLRLCQRENWGKRELERQLSGAFFERTVLSPPKLAPAVRELHPEAASVFKDTYPLTVPVEKQTLAGKTVYSIARGLFIICLERKLTLKLIRAIAGRKPERVVLLDEGFARNDQLKANAVQIFKTKSVTSFKTV